MSWLIAALLWVEMEEILWGFLLRVMKVVEAAEVLAAMVVLLQLLAAQEVAVEVDLVATVATLRFHMMIWEVVAEAAVALDPVQL
jgi:hypothetical protein